MQYRTSRTVTSFAASSAGSPSALWNWAIAGVCVGLLVALVVFAPARWLAEWVYKASGERVSLVASRGTVWHGTAQSFYGLTVDAPVN